MILLPERFGSPEERPDDRVHGGRGQACRGGKALSWFWKCNFPMTPPVRLLVSFGWLVRWSFGWSVGLSKFPKRARSYTSLLLSEHFFYHEDSARL